jgi:hypothetical protein
MRKGFILAVSFVLGCAGSTEPLAEDSAALSGAPCPDLAGSYHCTSFYNQPPYDLTITQTHNNENTATYLFNYSFVGPQQRPWTASPEGTVQHGDFIAQCTGYEGTSAFLIYPKDGDPTTQGTYNFINETGDFQADYGGKPAIICTRD